MKITKTASGKEKVILSKKDWQEIGKKAGWIKTASICKECGHECSFEECMDEAGVFKGCPECGSKNVEK